MFEVLLALASPSNETSPTRGLQAKWFYGFLLSSNSRLGSRVRRLHLYWGIQPGSILRRSRMTFRAQSGEKMREIAGAESVFGEKISPSPSSSLMV